MYRRGPGLVGTMARTAVIAGTATAVSGGMMRRQENRAMEQQEAAQQQMQAQQPQAQMQQMQAQQATANVTGGISEDSINKLQQLATLHSQGILTDAEFTAQKAAILGS